MTPDERAARLHLTDAAAALRTASERLCDWLEATGQDVAGNGHVASADEAAGSFRGAPTAPVSSSPPPIPLGAVVEVEGDGKSPFTRAEGLWLGVRGSRHKDGVRFGISSLLTALYHARREAEEARKRIAGLEEERNALGATADEAERMIVEWATKCGAAERERDAACGWQDQADAWCAVFDALEVVRPGFSALGDTGQEAAVRAIRELASERDEARRELAADRKFGGRLGASAAAKDQGLGASAISSRQAPNSEELDCGSAVASPAPASAPLSETAPLSGAGNTADSGNQAPATPEGAKGVDISIVETPLEYGTTVRPAPASAPRRWWLVIDADGNISVALSEETAREWAALWSKTDNVTYNVVPVIEARVTRETVERVAAEIRFAPRCEGNLSEIYARAALSALGLTVEGDHA